jgi:hypothetical protein
VGYLLDDAVELLSAGKSHDEVRTQLAASDRWRTVRERLIAGSHDDLFLWLEELLC